MRSGSPLAGIPMHSLKLAGFASGFLRIDNLLDLRYESFGLYGQTSSVFPSFSDNQFRTPGTPRAFWAGLRAKF